MPAGRPTLYDPSFYHEAVEYLKSTGKENMELPTIEGFAHWLRVHRDTLYEWAKKYPEFSDTLKEIEQLQKIQLINDGIYGGKEVNATIVKLLLQNNHGMKERSDFTTNDKDLPQPLLGGKAKDSV